MTEPKLKTLKLNNYAAKRTQIILDDVPLGEVPFEDDILEKNTQIISDDVENEDPTKLKLSITHEEELVVKAIKYGSAMKGIKWYYETYRPEDFKRHNDKRDWSKNCRVGRARVNLWMKKFEKTGYHRLDKIKVIGQLARPKEGINSLQTITLTEYQKNILVHTAFTNEWTAQKTIKARLKINRFINF